MREATGRYLSFDGKLWRTLVPLLFHPGFLTRAYLAGRRKRYIGPARLFLISSLFLFAVLRFATESIDIDSVIHAEPSAPAAGSKAALKEAVKDERGEIAKSVPNDASKDESKAAPDNQVALDHDFDLGVVDLPVSIGPVKKRFERFNHLPRAQKFEQILAGALRYGPYAMFVLLPAFAALLKLVYLGRRRRYPGRPRLYGEHLVFAAHNHAFLFVVGGLLFTVPGSLARQAIAVWAFAYLAWSIHAVYGGSWAGIIARGFALLVPYAVLFGLATAGLVIVAILLR